MSMSVVGVATPQALSSGAFDRVNRVKLTDYLQRLIGVIGLMGRAAYSLTFWLEQHVHICTFALAFMNDHDLQVE